MDSRSTAKYATTLFEMSQMIKHNGKGGSKVPDKVRQQQESAEALAKSRAEKLFSAPEPAEQPASPAKVAEPTLEQRLADIDRRSRERAAEEKRGLAMHYLDDAKRAFKKALSNTTDENLKKAYEEMTRLEKLTEGSTAPSGSRISEGLERATGLRVRRSADDLKGEAEKLVEFLKANPGSKGSAVTEATGVTVKQPLNVRTFIEKYMPGTKVKTEGQKAGTVYSIA